MLTFIDCFKHFGWKDNLFVLLSPVQHDFKHRMVDKNIANSNIFACLLQRLGIISGTYLLLASNLSICCITLGVCWHSSAICRQFIMLDPFASDHQHDIIKLTHTPGQALHQQRWPQGFGKYLGNLIRFTVMSFPPVNVLAGVDIYLLTEGPIGSGRPCLQPTNGPPNTDTHTHSPILI